MILADLKNAIIPALEDELVAKATGGNIDLKLTRHQCSWR
jgi:hypothetical protein